MTSVTDQLLEMIERLCRTLEMHGPKASSESMLVGEATALVARVRAPAPLLPRSSEHRTPITVGEEVEIADLATPNGWALRKVLAFHGSRSFSVYVMPQALGSGETKWIDLELEGRTWRRVTTAAKEPVLDEEIVGMEIGMHGKDAGIVAVCTDKQRVLVLHLGASPDGRVWYELPPLTQAEPLWPKGTP